MKRWYATKLARKFFHKYATTVGGSNLIGLKIGMVLTERRKKRDFDVLQDPRGGPIVPVVPSLFPRSANYPEQCGVIKRNAFPDKQQISRWNLAYYASEEFAAFWMLDSFVVLGTIWKQKIQERKYLRQWRRSINNYILSVEYIVSLSTQRCTKFNKTVLF